MINSFTQGRRYTFRLDLSWAFDAMTFSTPPKEIMALETLTIVVTNTAARLSAVTSFVLALARAPNWISHVRCARVHYLPESEGSSSEMGAKRLKMSDT